MDSTYIITSALNGLKAEQRLHLADEFLVRCSEQRYLRITFIDYLIDRALENVFTAYPLKYASNIY